MNGLKKVSMEIIQPTLTSGITTLIIGCYSIYGTTNPICRSVVGTGFREIDAHVRCDL